MPAISLIEHDVASLESSLIARVISPSHARPILRSFYAAAGCGDFSDTNAPLALRRELSDGSCLHSRILHRHTSADGTIKILLEFPDGKTIESVLMGSHRPGVAAGCLSSQVGCPMGCDFCATAKMGLVRNLHHSEIVEQFLHLKRLAMDSGRKLSTIVFMGMGEPLLNLDNLLPAIKRIADPDLGAVGWRQVTVSTVGIVPGIDALADADLNVHLALSLHAPDDATRSQIVPPNRRYPVADILAATKRFYAATHRVPTIEYCLLAGVNDSDDHARMLADLLAGFRAHVNLIPFNPIGPGLSGKIYERPSHERILAFLSILHGHRVVAHIRQTRGDDVSAACGQLTASAS